jgi:hypothetical protein
MVKKEETILIKPTRRETTDCITRSVIAYLVHKRLAVFKELGLLEWGKRRVDVMALAMKKRTITVVEVKSCHADFKSDLKLEEYLPYSNIMYIAVPDGSTWMDQYKPRLKELGIGLMVLGKYGVIKITNPAKKRTMKKKAKYSLLVRLAYRCASFSLRTHKQRLARTTASGLRYQDLAERRKKL